MGLFGPKLPINDDEFEWQLACIKWLLDGLGGIERHDRAPLVTPTVDCFPNSAKTGHNRALELFEQVRLLAGVEDQDFVIEAGAASRDAKVQAGVALVHDSHPPLGTYRVEERSQAAYQPIITYNPALIDDPAALVATFAHELAHWVLDGFETLPPGGRELGELATDITAVFLGFGIFLANNAKSFAAYQTFDEMGWSSSQSGYVSEGGLVTALAMAERLAGRDPLAATAWLKPHLAADLKKADRYLAKRHPDLAVTVMAVDLAEFTPEA